MAEQLLQKDHETTKEERQRTLAQNRALHKWYSMLSDKLNEMGLDMKVVLAPSVQIWWTPESVKENLWRPIMKAMYNIESTTDLNTAQLTKVHEQLMQAIGEKHGVHIPFPSQEETEEYLDSFNKHL